MTMSDNQLRQHALAFVRRQILRSAHTESDLAKWAEELGPVVYEIEIELRPEVAPKPKRKPKAEALNPEPEAAPLEEMTDGTS